MIQNMQYKDVQKLPDTPGVYFFLDKRKKPIYIGKATSLKDRVRSYFANDLIQTRGPLLVKMLEEAKSVEFKKTDSVLEALLLEADLIKDTSWGYIGNKESILLDYGLDKKIQEKYYPI